MTVPNSVFTAASTGSLDATGITVATLLATSQISAGSVYAPLGTIAQFVSTNLSSGSVSATSATVPQIVATNVSSGTISGTSMTVSNSVFTASSTGSLDATGITVATLLATSQISAGSVYAPLATIAQFVSTNLSSGTVSATSATVPQIVATNVTTGTLRASTSLFANTIDMTPSLGDIIKEVSFTAGNNQALDADVTGLAFDNTIVRSFNSIVSVTLIKSSGSSLYANYELKGIQKGTGEWVLNTTYVGDNTGLFFSVANIGGKGQIQYTSTSQANWTSTTLKFKANTTSI
jgi:hypothetical protein